MGVHGGIQDAGLLGGDQAGEAVCLADEEGVVAVQVVGGDEIVLALPAADGGVGLAPGHGELEAVLVDTAGDGVLAGLCPVDGARVPVHALGGGAAIGIVGDGADGFQVGGGGGFDRIRHIVGHVHRGEEAAPQAADGVCVNVGDTAGYAAFGQVQASQIGQLLTLLLIFLRQGIAQVQQGLLGVVDQIVAGEEEDVILTGGVGAAIALDALSHDGPLAAGQLR